VRWRYFPKNSTVLLDKIYKFESGNRTYELGGEAARDLMISRGTIAVHTTCYEQYTKVMGLKVSD
jgi:hypothetical protein